SALQKLNRSLRQIKPETLVVITPHGLVYPDRFNVCAMPFLEGDLASFGAPEVRRRFQNDLELVFALDKKCQQNGIPLLPYDNGQEVYELDHGTLVPLYYLAKGLRTKLVSITYSFLPVNLHYQFGQVLGNVIGGLKRKIAVIASGDLSHRLKFSQYGYSEAGEVFDRRLQECLKKGDTKAILSFDEELLEEAGECGYRSIVILLGVLHGKKWKGEILSYEAPFGIGYMVAELKFQ
ncbi:AmmeMemoRadiSam system protein B, partial [bacterium]|nr:AmmeMemoRadiSam system protein B [bacterium]